MKATGLTERSLIDPGMPVRPCDPAHMDASACTGMLSALHHQGFHTYPTTDNPYGWWLEVWWLTDVRTGAVHYVYEDTRGLNRPGPRFR